MAKPVQSKPRSKRFDDADCYFDQFGSGWMKLSKGAAENAVARILEGPSELLEIEGGIWRNPGFEARLDAIIAMRHFDKSEYANIVREYFRELPDTYDTFIVTSR